MTLDELRVDFERTSNRSMSMPIAGAIAWSVVAILSVMLEFHFALVATFICTGMIFLVAIGIGKIRSEEVLSNKNPMAKLMGMCAFMVNLLWAVHIPLFLYAPQFVPLSLGISIGLHWIVYSWIIQHPLGIIHAVLRTILIVLAWFVFAEHRPTSISLVIVFVYLLTLYQMNNRRYSVQQKLASLEQSQAEPAA
tara:strand:+ start:272 stop:853 length:582 start_codon:yes stop_codon:yes gene_type:complete